MPLTSVLLHIGTGYVLPVPTLQSDTHLTVFIPTLSTRGGSLVQPKLINLLRHLSIWLQRRVQYSVLVHSGPFSCF